mgnify:CR=1 FL=1
MYTCNHGYFLKAVLLTPMFPSLSWTESQSCVLMVDAEANVYIISNKNGGHGMIVMIEADMWGQSEPVFLSSESFFGMESTHHDPASK